MGLVFQQILQALWVRQTLNSSPIDELGEGAYEGGWWCQAKCEHPAGHAGIHGNPESGNHHPAPSH